MIFIYSQRVGFHHIILVSLISIFSACVSYTIQLTHEISSPEMLQLSAILHIHEPKLFQNGSKIYLLVLLDWILFTYFQETVLARFLFFQWSIVHEVAV